MKTYYLSNEQMLQNFGAMFENLSKEGDLKTELAEYGYDDAKIAEGKALYDEARKTFDANIKETREETSASLAFQEKYQNVQKKYSTHRKRHVSSLRTTKKLFVSSNSKEVLPEPSPRQWKK
ncbi:hypothetical protein [Capnocytophaga catalasegens]|uniref:Uncharacterized protein n=1 Tax=Capnocytophaga catalasegens TaxID=1004260 RepID=A0AAV5B0V2_9FLAO|nr:hypothetical protein [Capnocytophaga catalasegens]GIZ14018.1 hypothetical protein RCZ03_00190 [Capnocytophaga catalasegens]GJM51097.1 hypothetical protein RCZ15_20700 [Capnocytophaga catalasegens]GJM54093.1 hypothetical protein RCZ16_24090 [Capnocytophaga catalasegens]